MVNKLVGPWIQPVFPNKWKQRVLADGMFGWGSGDQDFIPDFFADLLCDFWGSRLTGLCFCSPSTLCLFYQRS